MIINDYSHEQSCIMSIDSAVDLWYDADDERAVVWMVLMKWRHGYAEQENSG